MLPKIANTARMRTGQEPAASVRSTRRPDDLGWTLRLLRPTGLKISLFRFKLHGLTGPAAIQAHDLLAARLGKEGQVQQLGDGSTLVLVIRYDDDPDSVTARLANMLAATMREPDWPCRAVAELMGVHHHAAEIGHVGDLLTELTYAPRQVIEVGRTLA